MSLKPNVQRIVDIMSKDVAVEKTGEPKITEGLFGKTLPEDLSMETCEKVGQHNADYIAAGNYTVGMAAVAAMKSRKDLNEVQVTLPMAGKDSASYRVVREKTFPGVNGGAEVTKYGVVQTTYDCYAGMNKGNLKTARDMVAEHAAVALVSKK